ncbi:hypothetical protein HF329_28930 [Chitinophaga oryzae]|uniref:Uncharacterized protein n=1 Tax=Chitinophaga oryzae TaxID=2725414 RepID=A0AAE6ZL87_9BACT|nr:hypothetical protein [Chitinophaga oryzae]QJB35111.1 hypothetical protein HF329_28930 [Chitinophaga oryzae]
MTKKVDFPNADYSLQWLYKDPDQHIYEDYNTIGVPDERIFEDIHRVLEILQAAQLLIPTNLNRSRKFGFSGTGIDDIVTEIRQWVRSRVVKQKLSVYGHGIVKLPNGEEAVLKDMVHVADLRFTERSFKIATAKTIWVPVVQDDADNYNWQIGLAELNAPRLENCLAAIFHKLKLEVTPGLEEEDRSKPVWQKGFKLFPSREAIESAYIEDPPPPSFDIAKYLLPKTEADH